MGITGAGFVGWKRRYKDVRYALKQAKKDKSDSSKLNLHGFVKNQLPPKLQQAWDKITEYGKETSGYGKIEKMMGKESRHIRQELLIYAIMMSGFSLSKALRKVAIPRATFNRWKENDADFVELYNEVEHIKKDFIEESFLRLIRDGDSPATIVGNRTLNRDRGYGEVSETIVSGMIGVASVQIGELDLPPEILRAVLEAVKQRELEKTAQKKILPAGMMNAPMPQRKLIESKVG